MFSYEALPPSFLTAYQEYQVPFHHPYLGAVPFIFKPKPKPQESSYADLDLTCSEAQKQTIYDLIEAMAHHSTLWLLNHRSELNAMGNSIQGVHPLKFLETIFSNAELTQDMKEIFKSYFKRKNLMEGLGDSLTLKAKSNDLNIFLPDFAKAVGVTTEEISLFFESKDWEGLVRYLMNRNPCNEEG